MATVYAEGGAGGMSKNGSGNGVGGTGSSASSIGTVKIQEVMEYPGLDFMEAAEVAVPVFYRAEIRE